MATDESVLEEAFEYFELAEAAEATNRQDALSDLQFARMQSA